MALKPVPFTEVEIADSFWAPRLETTQSRFLTASTCTSGAGHIGSSELAAAQLPDGYLNTDFQVNAPGRRWTNLRDDHELYCAGRLFEAAVAHHRATGERTLLDVAIRFADHIDFLFGEGRSKRGAIRAIRRSNWRSSSSGAPPVSGGASSSRGSSSTIEAKSSSPTSTAPTFLSMTELTGSTTSRFGSNTPSWATLCARPASFRALSAWPDLLDGVVALEGVGQIAGCADWAGRLYQTAEAPRQTLIRAIPYYAWDNRAPGPWRFGFPYGRSAREGDWVIG